MDLIANWSKAMNEEMKTDQRVLSDDELEAVNGGAVNTTAHIVTFTQSVSFSAPLHFGPILLPPSPCWVPTPDIKNPGRLACDWGLIGPAWRRSTWSRRAITPNCIIAEWVDMADLAAARPSMIATLNSFRDTLEDLGGELGVTDPVSGPVVLELK
jgi:hypothetical protein